MVHLVDLLSEKRIVRMPALVWAQILVVADVYGWQKEYAEALDPELWTKKIAGQEAVDMDNHFVSYPEAKSMIDALGLADIRRIMDYVSLDIVNRCRHIENMPSDREISDIFIGFFKDFIEFVKKDGPFVISSSDPGSFKRD